MSADDTAPSGDLREQIGEACHAAGLSAGQASRTIGALLPVVTAEIERAKVEVLREAAADLARYGETADGAEALLEMVAKMEAGK